MTTVILFLAIISSLKDWILKLSSFIKIFPKLTASVLSGVDLIPSPYSFIMVNTPQLNSNEPSEEIPALFALMIYSPFDFLNTSEVWLPPLIIFLHNFI